MMDKQLFKDILAGIVSACNGCFYDGVKNIRPTALECATKIYIETIKAEKRDEENGYGDM